VACHGQPRIPAEAGDMIAHQTPPHHLWASPGIKAADPPPPLIVVFDYNALDFLVVVPSQVSDAILTYELPHLCDARPHEDPNVEAWLAKWQDGDEQGGEFSLPARCLPGLTALTAERPEVCPMLRSQLERFEKAMAAWLKEWPQAEPPRLGLPRTDGSLDGAPPAEVLELELYTALYLLRDALPRNSAALTREVAEDFRQVAFGWIFKLDSLYKLSVTAQPERVSTAANGAGAQLSLLNWAAEEVIDLLRCPFFRPQEFSLWCLARRWWLEGLGAAERAASVTEGFSSAESGGRSMDTSISNALIWDLLPPTVSLPKGGASPDGLTADGGASDEATSAGPGGGAAGAADEASGGADRGTEGRAEAPGICIGGSSFALIPRSPDENIGSRHDDPSSLHLRTLEGSESLHCWNDADETQVVGAARQLIASSVPMSPGGGVYRLDLRVLSGIEAEAAHLFEVGIAADPTAGLKFKVSGPGAFRPALRGNAEEDPSPFFSFVAVPDMLLEGVRLAVEVDFDERTARVRNIPSVDGVEGVPIGPTPISTWLSQRANVVVQRSRPAGELEDPLFRHQAEHLHEMIDEGTLHEDLASTVLQDMGAQCIRGTCVPVEPEDYFFYVVMPAGLEVEIY